MSERKYAVYVDPLCEACIFANGGACTCIWTHDDVRAMRADLARVTAERDELRDANAAARIGAGHRIAEWIDRAVAADLRAETAERELAEARAHHDGYRVTAQEAIDQARARVSELEVARKIDLEQWQADVRALESRLAQWEA